VAQFRYLGTKVTDKNLIQKKIKRRLNSGNACYYSVQNFLSYRLLSKNIKIRICKIIILPVILYRCETWSLTLREEHRLKVFENRLLRRMFGQKRNEATGEGRKLHEEELRGLYSLPSIIRIMKSRRMRLEGHVARMGKKRNAYRLLTGKPEGKKPLGRPSRSGVNNIRMDLGGVGCGDLDWIVLAQDRNRWRALVNSVLNLRVP
jgi:hypothetical protein